MDVILILLRELINEVVNNHVGLLLKDINHGLLLDGEFWLGDFFLFKITVISIPRLLFPILWLNLDLKKLNKNHSERVVLQFLQKSIKDLSLLLNEEVSQDVGLLL